MQQVNSHTAQDQLDPRLDHALQLLNGVLAEILGGGPDHEAWTAWDGTLYRAGLTRVLRGLGGRGTIIAAIGAMSATRALHGNDSRLKRDLVEILIRDPLRWWVHGQTLPTAASWLTSPVAEVLETLVPSPFADPRRPAPGATAPAGETAISKVPLDDLVFGWADFHRLVEDLAGLKLSRGEFKRLCADAGVAPTPRSILSALGVKDQDMWSPRSTVLFHLREADKVCAVARRVSH